MKRHLLFISLLFAIYAQAATQITIAEFISNADTETTYRLRGEVTNIKNTTYGNFTLKDETGSIYIYGLLNEAGQSKQFASMGIEEGDTLTLEGTYTTFNSSPQIASAQYISHVKPAVVWVPIPVSISDFISYNDGKRYILTGVVTSIANSTYGNLYIEDASGSIYVYGLTDAAGTYQSFNTLGVEVGDTLTLSGIYQFYSNTTPEVTSARYISHVKPSTNTDPINYDETEVDFETAFASGWSGWIGKTLTFTNDFYLCNTTYDVIAPHRLRSPEEYGDQGTAAYTQAVADNTRDSCVLSGVYFQSGCRPGAIIRGLQATVTSANNLQATNTPAIIYNELPTQRPDLGDANVVICGANLENFFVTLGGYAGAGTEARLEKQKTKISVGLYHMDADIYALCEVERGQLAAPVLVELLNDLAGVDQYDWVNAGFDYDDAIMVCYIYRKDKIEPYGDYITPYSYTTSPYHYREAIQCFKHKATGEKFNISLNHFKAKDSSTDAGDGTRQSNMNMVTYQFSNAAANDPDILVMGDLNAYTNEESNLILSRDKGYTDLLMRDDPDGYSYVYNDLVGYLDHAYANSSMAAQVTKAVPYHLNADTDEWNYCYKSSNTSMYRYADHDPILIGLKLGENSSTEMLDVNESKEPARKVLENGQVIIIRNNVRYTITGLRL